MSIFDIETIANWSVPQTRQTIRGVRFLRFAEPGEKFWEAWRSNKEKLKAAGVCAYVDDRTGKYQICWWTEPVDQKQIEASSATDAVCEVPTPPGLQYLPFQKAGIAYALDPARPNGCTLVADEMGTGKTVVSTGVINVLAATAPHSLCTLVVCPASVKRNWAFEAERWLVRKHSIIVINAGDNWPEVNSQQNVLVIVNYDLLCRFLQFIESTQWDLLILDEAHYCKNNRARRTQAALGIKARRKLFLTGTPVTNRPIDLWPILHCAAPNTWASWKKFVTRYCAAYRNRFGWVTDGASNLDELHVALRSTIMIRRLKSDVLAELPPKRRQIILIDADSNSIRTALRNEHELMENLRVLGDTAATIEALSKIDAEQYKTAVESLKADRSRLMTDMARARHETALAKTPAAITHIKDALEGTNKIVVFAHHRDVIELLAGAFAGQCVVLTGDTPADERQDIVDRFQTDPRIRLFIGSTTAAGVGLTLTAASTVIFVELDWVPATLQQGEDRLHRMGQQADCVLVQHIVVDGSIDSRLAKVVLEKQSVIGQALDEPVDLLDLTAKVA